MEIESLSAGISMTRCVRWQSFANSCAALALPGWVGERLKTATTDKLEAWGEALVDTRTLEEVFDKK